MADRDRVRQAFQHPTEFTTSPLYRALSQTVATHDQLLDLAARGRPGQYPTFLFFGAVHQLLLRGADHPLARFYPSIAGRWALPPDEVGPALVSFGVMFETELAEIISSRLVQTNHVQRALGLRLGLSMIAAAVTGPVHLIEVGASAGFNLRFDRYGYRLDGLAVRGPRRPGAADRGRLRPRAAAGPGRAAGDRQRAGRRPQPGRRPRSRRPRVAGGARVAGEPWPAGPARPGAHRHGG